MGYKIIYGETVEALEENVSVFIADGWRPQGGVTIHAGIIYQAMVRD